MDIETISKMSKDEQRNLVSELLTDIDNQINEHKSEISRLKKVKREAIHVLKELEICNV